MRSNSQIKTTVVGSYPVPDWLKSHPNEETLIDAMAVVMRAQEVAGIDVISDGELSRWDLARSAPGGMVERFIRPMTGVQVELTRTQLDEFRARSDMAYRKAPAGIVTGPLGDGMLDLKSDWDLAQELTQYPLKFTLTSPYMLAKVISNNYYTSFQELVMSFADILSHQLKGIAAAVVQVDEPNLPGSPQDSGIAADAINRVLDSVPRDKRAVHLCFGNYGGQTIQKGDYAHLIDFMNTLHCDHLVLETTRRPPDELRRLREVKSEIQFGIGVIDVKDLQIESPDRIAQRIEVLADTLGEGRIAYIHPDCGLRMLPRAVADGKMRALVAGRDLYLGRSRT
jgi:5-methyltetrahydropteroyltriglutamate--homocysteine methyltransferase